MTLAREEGGMAQWLQCPGSNPAEEQPGAKNTDYCFEIVTIVSIDANLATNHMNN